MNMTSKVCYNYKRTGIPKLPKATGQRMLFTGPDGIGDYRAKNADFPHHIGEGELSREATSRLDYLYRAAPGSPAPRPKHCYVGGVGWGVLEYSVLNSRTLKSNMQFKLVNFRQACEDKVTHRYQNPWQPSPHILDEQPGRARSKLGWTHNLYDDYCYGNSTWTRRYGDKKLPAATPICVLKNRRAQQSPRVFSEESIGFHSAQRN